MKNVFKNGYGHTSTNKKQANEIAAVLIKLGKIPIYDNGLPVDCHVTTHKKSALTVLGMKGVPDKPNAPDTQGLIFTYDGSRLLVVGVPSYKQLQEYAMNKSIKTGKKIRDITWSEILSFSKRGHFTVV